MYKFDTHHTVQQTLFQCTEHPFSIAGQCRTNPWPAVPDWPWCRIADAGLKKLTAGKNADAGLTFLRHFHTIFQHHKALITPAVAVYGRGVYDDHFPLASVCSVDVRGKQYRNVGLSGLKSVRYRNEQKRRCRDQSGTRIRKPSPLRIVPVPAWDTGCPECRCRRHRPRCRCPAMPFSVHYI